MWGLLGLVHFPEKEPEGSELLETRPDSGAHMRPLVGVGVGTQQGSLGEILRVVL